MTKVHISYRNAKGHMKSADPLNCPDDAPEAVKIAAEAVALALGFYGPPKPVEGAVGVEVIADTVAQEMARDMAQGQPKPKGKRGRPVGYKCSPETRAQMAASKRAMWQEIKATMTEVHPDKGWEG